MIEIRLPMLEYDFSKQPDQGLDEFTGEHGGYEMGVRGSSMNGSIFLDQMKFGFFLLLSASVCTNVSRW